MESPLVSSLNCDPPSPTTKEEKEVHQEQSTHHEFAKFKSTLPREMNWIGREIYQYQGFWYVDHMLQGIISLQKYFKSESADVLLASSPKSGTTWLMALVFAIENRFQYDFANHPLLATNPHELIPNLEVYASKNQENPNLDGPILSTHLPYTLLPPSLLRSGCRIVYMVRDPKDVFVSFWHFTMKIKPKDQPNSSIEEAFDMFCNGFSLYGPYWEHVIGYCKASLECPKKVLLLKYDDMKREPLDDVKKLADFLGHPFSLDEESDGVIEKIISLCSFENLSNLEVNKTGRYNAGYRLVTHNNMFFRKGKTGDWQNHLTKEMAERIDRIIVDKFRLANVLSKLEL